jgi:hypothetical protein
MIIDDLVRGLSVGELKIYIAKITQAGDPFKSYCPDAFAGIVLKFLEERPSGTIAELIAWFPKRQECWEFNMHLPH